jgi:hypothetical protein
MSNFVMFKRDQNCLSLYHKVKEIVFYIFRIYMMSAECLGASLGVLAGTLGVLGVLWYAEKRDKDRNPIIKKRQNREPLNERTLTN